MYWALNFATIISLQLVLQIGIKQFNTSKVISWSNNCYVDRRCNLVMNGRIIITLFFDSWIILSGMIHTTLHKKYCVEKWVYIFRFWHPLRHAREREREASDYVFTIFNIEIILPRCSLCSVVHFILSWKQDIENLFFCARYCVDIVVGDHIGKLHSTPPVCKYTMHV